MTRLLHVQAAETDNIILEHQRAARQKTLKEMGKEKEQTRSPKKSTKKLNPRLVEVLLDPLGLSHACLLQPLNLSGLQFCLSQPILAYPNDDLCSATNRKSSTPYLFLLWDRLVQCLG